MTNSSEFTHILLSSQSKNVYQLSENKFGVRASRQLFAEKYWFVLSIQWYVDLYIGSIAVFVIFREYTNELKFSFSLEGG